MKLSNLFIFLSVILCSSMYYFKSSPVFSIVLIVGCIFVMFIKYKDVNTFQVSLIMLLFYSVEYLLFNNVIDLSINSANPVLVGLKIYGTQIVIYSITILILFFRIPIFRRLSKSKSIGLTYQEGPITYLLYLSIFLSLLRMIENTIVNIDYLGVEGWMVKYMIEFDFMSIIYKYVAYALRSIMAILILSMIVVLKIKKSLFK